MAAALDSGLIAFAERLADLAGAESLRYFRQAVAVDAKADDTPVTIADRGAEAAMRAAIGAAYPAHGVVGEEYGPQRSEADYVWVLDPIDGTKAFITGNPQFGNLVALLYRGRPVLGIINMPAQGERWVGAVGHPTRFRAPSGEATARVRPCPRLAEATLKAVSPDLFADADADRFARVRRAVQRSLFGGDCFSYGQLASGWVDLVIEAKLQPYDYLALVPVIEGAGGRLTDWAGRALKLESDGRVLAAGDTACHEAALKLLQG